jgi:hypothetical protein
MRGVEGVAAAWLLLQCMVVAVCMCMCVCAGVCVDARLYNEHCVPGLGGG